MFYSIIPTETFKQGVFKFLTMITPYFRSLLLSLLDSCCHSSLNASKDLDLVLRKFTQVYPEKSSTHT